MMYTTEMPRYMGQKACTLMFIAVLFTIIKTGNHPRNSGMDKKIKTYSHKKTHIAMEMNNLKLLMIVWMNQC